MNDRQTIEQLYHDMYSAMVKKDEAELDRVHDESFVLIHMTGMHQNRDAEQKTVWVKDKCVMCLGCLHRCPKIAIQYGNGKTKEHGQYTNPNVKE